MKKIIVTGILDTKGRELKYIADKIKEAGGNPIILEISVGGTVGWADIGLEEVLNREEKTLSDLEGLGRYERFPIIVEGAKKIVKEFLDKDDLAGIIAYGGSMGASMATQIMHTIPVGIPKMMLTTMASGDVRPYIRTTDICMFYPIAEVGLNIITRRVLTNAAYGINGMAYSPELEKSEEKDLIGCMMFGVTTPTVLRASGHIEEAGYDVLINHSTGAGGMSMEELIDDGFIKGMLDITTHEIVDEMLGGVLSAGPERLTAAGRAGIPQVVAPGGLDLINFGGEETVLQKYLDEVEDGVRNIYRHNPTVTCVAVLPEEAYEVGKHMAEKLNKAKGPTVLCIPMLGWGAEDIGGPDPGTMWIPSEEDPKISLRAIRFIDGIKEVIDLDKENLEVLITYNHLNNPDFADLLSKILKDMLDGKWEKGYIEDSEDIVTLANYEG